MSKAARTQLDAEEEQSCPECKGIHLVLDEVRGELVCDSCGLVLQDHALDRSPEWSAYAPEDAARLAHTGAPRDPLSGATGLTTVIAVPHRDAHGNAIPSGERGAFYRMQKLQRHSSHAFPGERSLPTAIRVLDRYASLLALPKTVRNEAGFLCRKAFQRQLARGRSIETLVAGAVYAACRIDGVPRTLDELQQVTGIRKTRIGAAYRTLHRELSLAIHASQPADYVQRFCSELGLSAHVEREAFQLLQVFEPPESATSVSPCGTAGAAIYLAALVCGEPRSEKAIAKVAGVSEVTLRNRFQAMRAIRPEVVTPRGRVPKAPRP
ncbi:MAG TPA: TFIIB-type zinc ribbon-containing protein [Thermoplasmata archaeon]|nr:TFIIB-type zinc ribbon-containing protein [Thermoplasmata archaeon]